MSQTSLSSSNSSEISLSLNEVVARRHAAFISLPEELCPASRPSSPTSEDRVLTLKTRIMAAVHTAGGDTTHPKWGYVSRMARPGCTHRKYISIAPGRRIGDGRTATVGKKFKWELPETAEEWAGYERRFEKAVAEEEERKKAKESDKTKAKAKANAKQHRTSKYFEKKTAEEQQPEPPSRPSSKAEVIREKVERWQAQVAVVAAAPDVSMSQESVEVVLSAKTDKDKANDRPPQAEKVQAPLGFRVVKRASATSAKGGSGGTSKPKVSPSARVPTPLAEESEPSIPSKLHDEPAVHRPDQPVGEPEVAPVPVQITDVPELSFLPPSFPSQLQTSTPPPKDRRHKPPPIAPCSPPLSSPQSVLSLDPSRPMRSAPQQASSSSPALSPVRKPSKRARTPDPTPDDDRMDVSELQSPSGRSPLSKKVRMQPRKRSHTEQEPTSSGLAPVPPSTPPPSSSPNVAPVTPVSRGKGLGNAKGLPVPSTPNPHPLPVMIDLLASSRRSKPRPRPPSRKNTPHSKAASIVREMAVEHDSELPVVAEGDEHNTRESTPEPSPTKTYFSSPASGSSDSPGSVMHRSRSPVSPLFTQHPSAFMPRFTSTQRPGGDGDDPLAGGDAQTQASLMRGSSGLFAMGYSSQFDVEGGVEEVSGILERDVDFTGWLRDLGSDDDEEQDRDAPAGGQSQDAGVVVAGY